MKHLVTMAEQKGCHGGETKMVPRQHSGPGSSWRYRCKRRRADVRNMLEMVGCSRLPGSHGTVARQKRGIARIDHGAKLEHLIQHMHSVHGRRLGVIPSKRAFSERFESSREVVVHDDGRGTRDLGNGSRTCPERNLSHPRYSGVVEVVVQLLSWEVVVHGVGSGTRVFGRR